MHALAADSLGAKWREGSFGVRPGKARGEHNESGVPQKPEVVRMLSHFRVGPILLQNYFERSGTQY
jgi:hypothetical protein